MTVLYLDQTDEKSEMTQLVRQAIEREISRLDTALKIAQNRLAPFEERYGVSTALFLAEWAAEDLDGGDEEYIEWAGEAELYERLVYKLHRLQGIES